MTRPFKFVLIGAFLFLGLSCSNRTELPIPKEQLIPVLTDIHIVEALLLPMDKRSKDSMTDVYYQQVFDIHQVSKSDFDATMEILRKDPMITQVIYNEIVDTLQARDQQ